MKNFSEPSLDPSRIKHIFIKEKFISCLWNADFIWLLLILAIIFSISIIFGLIFNNGWKGAFVIWAFDHMLSLSLHGSFWENVISIILFLLTWLIGGGGLVSVFVNAMRRFDEKRDNGDIRIASDEFNRHILFLGWEKENVGIIKQLLKEEKHPGPVLILSNAVVGEIKYQLRDIMNTFTNVAFVFYRGDIESDDERKLLNTNHADYVFITGEEFGNSHDEYALLVSQTIDNNSKMIEIDSFELYCQYLKRNDAKLYFNFYHEWAKLILHNHPLHRNDNKPIHFIIVGFSDMGMALLLETVLKATAKTYITIYDDSQGINEIKIRSLFPNIDKLKLIHLTFISDIDIGSDEFINNIYDSADGSCDLTVAITCYDSSQSMAIMLPVCTAAGDESIVLLEQNIIGSKDNGKTLPRNVRVFGWESGVGIKKNDCCFTEDAVSVLGVKSSPLEAKDCLNQYMQFLKDFAEQKQFEMQKLCSRLGIETRLGGSLAYDALLKGDYDIDLRVLVSGCICTHRKINAVRDLLIKKYFRSPSFNIKLIIENKKNYIWHTNQIVKVPGIPGDPDVKLTWNIQSKKYYRGISEMAAKLPREVIDKYVVAKWTARQQSDVAYRALKKRWIDFIEWLIDNDGGKGMKTLLEEAEKANKIPSFLK